MVNNDGQWLAGYDLAVGPVVGLAVAAGFLVGVGMILAADAMLWLADRAFRCRVLLRHDEHDPTMAADPSRR